MTYGARLNEAIALAKSSRKALAAGLDISVQAIGDVINGKTKAFTAENNAKAARELRVDAHWLATGQGEPRSSKVTPIREARRLADDETRIEQFDTGGAMGHGLILQDQPGVIRSWTVTPDWIQKNVHRITSPKNLSIVTGFGDSMKGVFNPGDPLLVDTGVTRADIDGIYFFRVGEEGFIKRLQRIPTENGVVLRAKSENKAYDPFDITKGMDFEIFGRVVKAWESEDF